MIGLWTLWVVLAVVAGIDLIDGNPMYWLVAAGQLMLLGLYLYAARRAR